MNNHIETPIISDSVNVENQQGQIVNPATNEMVELLKYIAQLLSRPMTLDVNGRQRVVVEAGTGASVNLNAGQTLATLTTLSNLAAIGGMNSLDHAYAISRDSWANNVRARIT